MTMFESEEKGFLHRVGEDGTNIPPIAAKPIKFKEIFITVMCNFFRNSDT